MLHKKILASLLCVSFIFIWKAECFKNLITEIDVDAPGVVTNHSRKPAGYPIWCADICGACRFNLQREDHSTHLVFYKNDKECRRLNIFKGNPELVLGRDYMRFRFFSYGETPQLMVMTKNCVHLYNVLGADKEKGGFLPEQLVSEFSAAQYSSLKRIKNV